LRYDSIDHESSQNSFGARIMLSSDNEHFVVLSSIDDNFLDSMFVF